MARTFSFSFLFFQKKSVRPFISFFLRKNLVESFFENHYLKKKAISIGKRVIVIELIFSSNRNVLFLYCQYCVYVFSEFWLFRLRLSAWRFQWNMKIEFFSHKDEFPRWKVPIFHKWTKLGTASGYLTLVSLGWPLLERMWILILHGQGWQYKVHTSLGTSLGPSRILNYLPKLGSTRIRPN